MVGNLGLDLGTNPDRCRDPMNAGCSKSGTRRCRGFTYRRRFRGATQSRGARDVGLPAVRRLLGHVGCVKKMEETDPKETETKGHFPQRVEVTSESVDFIWLACTGSTTTNANGYLGRLEFTQTAQILTALLLPDIAQGGLNFSPLPM